MRLGFVVPRKNHLRHLGPLAARALERGHEVVLLCDYRGIQPHARWRLRRWSLGKTWEFPALEQMRAFANGAARLAEVRTDAELIETAGHLHAVFGLNQRALIGVADRLRARGVIVAQVQSTFEFIYDGDRNTKALFSDVAYGYADVWADWWLENLALDGHPAAELEALRAQMEARFVPVGLPCADLAPAFDPDEVRARFGLPRGKRVVLFLPFPFGKTTPIRRFGLGADLNARQVWPEGIYGASRAGQALTLLAARHRRHASYLRRGWNDRRLVAAVRRFCDANDALLVVKARFQTPPRGYLARAADFVVSEAPDRIDYPPAIMQLLAVSSLCIHFCSGGQYEAAVSRVPWLCVMPTREEWPHFYDRREHFEGFFDLYDWPGLGYVGRVPETIETLASRRLEDFPLVPERAEAYLRRFFLPASGRVADRVLDDLARRVKARP